MYLGYCNGHNIRIYSPNSLVQPLWIASATCTKMRVSASSWEQGVRPARSAVATEPTLIHPEWHTPVPPQLLQVLLSALKGM